MYSMPDSVKMRQNIIKNIKEKNADKKQKMMSEIGQKFSQNKNEMVGMPLPHRHVTPHPAFFQ